MLAGSEEGGSTPTLPAASAGGEDADPVEAAPLAGERVLTEVSPASRYFVNERGELLRIPPEIEKLLQEAMGQLPRDRRVRDGDPVPVDWRDH
jgi:hypothetical protein